MKPLVTDLGLGLVNGLAGAVADRPAPKDTPPAPNRPWSNRFKETGKPADYQLIDQIWLSPAAAGKLITAGIGRRTKLGGDATDHDPVWVDLAL